MGNVHQAEHRIIAEQALTHWDLAGAELQLVSLSENAVYRVIVADDKSYILRIHRPGYHTLAELNSELLWTAALNQAGIGVPAPVLTSNGQGYATVAVPGSDEVRQVGMVEWVDGVLLSSVMDRQRDQSALIRWFEQLGRISARIHNQAERWPIPETFTRHALDADGFMGEQPFWGRFWEIPQLEPAQRKLVSRAREFIYRALNDYGKSSGTYSLIHADLHPQNVLVDGDQLVVIDFDDAGFGWHQYELAVALFSFQGQDNYDAIFNGLIKGYRSERRLDDQSVQLIPMFLLIRGLALLGWIDQRPDFDGGEAYRSTIIPHVCEQAEQLLTAT